MYGEDEQTAEYVAATIGEGIDDIDNMTGKPVVVSVTTDNAPVMQSAWKILEREWSVCSRVEKLVFIFANAGDKDTKTSVLNNIRSGSESGGSDDADDDESKSEDGSVAGSSDDFSPSSMSRQDDFNVFSYDGSEEQKEST
ncbi:hypothetical protein PC116_g2358 [Phytophthora cactorum]|uniref:Uncharacterized protein n=1 Tax=Phytophthora cactorum TaxID=29920 RepID=A0A8T1E6Y4_9STRA|nr:hypothetical protein PC117_g6873 [Phytophthora cactorum]KAG4249998.1 hypothetical protein PC116_g2358 [Phytophthora cactorum]